MDLNLLPHLKEQGVKQIEVSEKSFKDLRTMIQGIFPDKTTVNIKVEGNVESINVYGIKVYHTKESGIILN